DDPDPNRALGARVGGGPGGASGSQARCGGPGGGHAIPPALPDGSAPASAAGGGLEHGRGATRRAVGRSLREAVGVPPGRSWRHPGGGGARRRVFGARGRDDEARWGRPRLARTGDPENRDGGNRGGGTGVGPVWETRLDWVG